MPRTWDNVDGAVIMKEWVWKFISWM